MVDAVARVTPKEWFIAMRPWSFTAAGIPVMFGAGLAALDGAWHLWVFVLTLLGGVALQAGTNLHNTYGDYVACVDSVDSAVTCSQLVKGEIGAGAMYRAGWYAFMLGAALALVLAWQRGPFILVFVALGVAGGYYYTNGKRPYKYKGLGPYYVFFLMGPLMALPAYVLQTGHLAVTPVLGSLSISCLVLNIMHANDIRDIEHDRAAGIRTLAMALGFSKAVRVYKTVNLAAFVLLALCIALQLLPLGCLLPFVLLPKLFQEQRRMASSTYNFVPLEGWAAQFHLQFGLLLVGGIGLTYAFRYWQGAL